ncbi:MAG: hypothetical protein ABJP45_01530 [Cyclobacteriaceae bacterium]
MKPLQEMVLLSEIVLQAKIARLAAKRLNEIDHVEVWCSIQSILVASGNVSKILWPSRKESRSRGMELRKMLQIEDNNILSSRKFRNLFEHYDERIEEWFSKQSSGVYTDLAMNPSQNSFMSQTVNRGYNSINNTLVFRGEILDLNEVLNSLNEILKKCKSFVLT